MNCCPQCFPDTEMKGIISSISTEKGTCDYCHSDNQMIISIEEIQDNFIPLLDLYETDETSNESLCARIHFDWNVFSSESLCTRILHDIFDKSEYGSLLSGNVRMKYSEEGNSATIWESFVDEIKTKNRFFITNNIVVRDVVEKLLRYHSKELKAGTTFYRGRICNDVNGYEENDLWQPPCGKASPGRANPKGISYLYLANDQDTTLYEVRASFLDYVCVGQFELKENIRIVALKDVHNASPFLEDINLQEYVTNKNILKQFGDALSKPLRRFESDTEYLPTQYLCEYIKSLGILGVEYASAMHKGGINYAFFDASKFTFLTSSTLEVTNINIEIA